MHAARDQQIAGNEAIVLLAHRFERWASHPSSASFTALRTGYTPPLCDTLPAIDCFR